MPFSSLFTSSFIAEMKRKLEEERTQLKQQLQAISEKGVHALPGDFVAAFPSYGDKEDENAAEVAQYTDNLSLEHTLERMLTDAEAALLRIADGTYGTCRYCGTAIDERRLSVRPSSSSCVACKQRLKATGAGK